MSKLNAFGVTGCARYPAAVSGGGLRAQREAPSVSGFVRGGGGALRAVFCGALPLRAA